MIGLGVIGAGWVAEFLGAGLQVRCFDTSDDAAARLESFLTQALGSPPIWRERLHLAASLEDAVEGVDLVQENGPEAAQAKAALIASLDAAATSRMLIASSTSGHKPSDLQAMAPRHPERVFVAHPLNPPHLIPLVEVVPGALTTPSLLAQAVGFYTSLGKRVVVPRHERPAHVANRLQAALLREAFAIAMEGTLDVPDIDAVLTHGLALRWACAGPFALTELGGGSGKSRAMLSRLGPALNAWWQDLSRLDLDDRARQAVLEAIERHPPAACSDDELGRLIASLRRYQAFCAAAGDD
ncbi:3-hydroxyacyl-CoA dehydrogenase NAD-binding domain-containing protein [Piscinibacter sp.]|uniref:3-hydroxyacyl-CoA dehydrogenase NAD-binding domain-containing protein n=1 Tax=Piscinibacter sp. TaxID=1903157 RepID=UPI002C3921AB|nr:3-hydroxyacyl-CoA dehydrogenase NAD-binding domain-containing protein [Albitalea sp.]HUG21798.1 3-hydroxyacyl-CoA dehydrogenase NAD-binding domain-containing protein [Albitalea sp.]